MRVTANERRRAILETLCRRRRDTRENLAFEFGVSVRTIEYDVQRLSQSYPIYTEQGRAGGIPKTQKIRKGGKQLQVKRFLFLVAIEDGIHELLLVVNGIGWEVASARYVVAEIICAPVFFQ